MTRDQIILLVLLGITVVLFLWARWRHDIVALGALLAAVAAGLVPSGEAFAGFGHPAVITVACVLVLSGALQSTGAIDWAARAIMPRSSSPAVMIGALSGFAAVLSGFMNNVGALALLMPFAIQVAARLDLPPGRVLMPLAFGSILGGMTTLIGTPPNLIVSGFRAQNGAGSFAMFDFAPVGLAVALAGIAFLVLGGWRLVPARPRSGAETFETGAYLTEALVPDGSKAAGMMLRDVEAALDEADAQVVGLVRNETRIPAPNPWREVRAGDILVIEAEPEALNEALGRLDLKLAEAIRPKPPAAQGDGDGQGSPNATSLRTAQADETDAAQDAAPEARRTTLQSDEVVLMELAVRPRADLVGRSASSIRLRTRFGINLLAVSREGRRSRARLRTMPIAEGDVLLMQGPPDAIMDFANRFGCVPLAHRELRIPAPRKALLAAAILACAIGGAAFGLVPAAVAFAAGLVAVVLSGVVPVKRVYDAIDWSVIVLLAALIPVAGAMATTGTADLIAKSLVGSLAAGHPVIALVLILAVTMTLSDFMNNAATAAVMCPVAIGTAGQLGVSADPFLMAVAVGASCAFLTPIGHQNNTLILGPGGFRFGDYWPLGLPLEVLVVLVATPMILLVWPL
jgi:di/tricarboxylate transporter